MELPKRHIKRIRNTPPGMKVCGHCAKELPQNADWYDRDASKPDGFKNWCKACRKERQQLAESQGMAEVVKTLDKALLANLTQATPGGSVTPHQLEFFQYVTTLMGGVQGAAMNFMATFIAAKPGSQTRERLLGQYMKLMAVCSGDGKVSPPPELMSDDDLSAAIARDEERMRRNEERLRSAPPVEGNITDVP